MKAVSASVKRSEDRSTVKFDQNVSSTVRGLSGLYAGCRGDIEKSVGHGGLPSQSCGLVPRPTLT